MALLNSLFSGVSGMTNLQSMMDVIGNNIANVDTIGFKGSRVTFSDTFNQFIQSGTNPTSTSGGTNSFQIGLGSKINSIDRNWSQGTFEQTGNTTDLALQGPGLFIVKSNGQNYYTRAGAFTFDSNGDLVNPQNGAIVQGKVAVDGIIPSGNVLQDIKIDKNLTIPAVKTTSTTWGGNLQSSATTTNPSKSIVQTGVFDPSNLPADCESTIYDKNGNALSLKVTYSANKTDPTKYDINYEIDDSSSKPLTTGNLATGISIDSTTGPGTYTIPSFTGTTSTGTGIQTGDISLDATAVRTGSSNTLVDNVDSSLVTGSISVYDSLGNAHTLNLNFWKTAENTWDWKATIPDADGALSNNSGEITFNPDGTLATPSSSPILTFDPTGGAESQNIALNFGSGSSGLTQNSGSSQVSGLTQNGSAAATLSNINIDQYGKVVGIFSNGQSKNLAQVMVATFANNNGLVSVGDNMYNVAANSGDPNISEPGETSATTIQSGALEQSNVDLSKEFTNMIVAQRGFEANAHVITTSDTLLQDITNLIR